MTNSIHRRLPCLNQRHRYLIDFLLLHRTPLRSIVWQCLEVFLNPHRKESLRLFQETKNEKGPSFSISELSIGKKVRKSIGTLCPGCPSLILPHRNLMNNSQWQLEHNVPYISLFHFTTAASRFFRSPARMPGIFSFSNSFTASPYSSRTRIAVACFPSCL